MNEKVKLLTDNIEKVIVGKTDSVLKIITAMLCGGHVLIEDVPGVGKTQLVSALAMYTHRRNGAFRASKQFLSWSETEVIILNEEEIKVLEKLLRDDKQLRHCTWNSEDFIYYIQAQDLQSGLKYGFGEYENEPTILGSIARFNRVENTIKLGYEINNCLSKDGWMVYNKLDGSYEYIFAEESAI